MRLVTIARIRLTVLNRNMYNLCIIRCGFCIHEHWFPVYFENIPNVYAEYRQTEYCKCDNTINFLLTGNSVLLNVCIKCHLLLVNNIFG